MTTTTKTHSFLTSLPLDLICAIVSCMRETESLKALSLTHSIFRDPCQKRLFATLALFHEPPAEALGPNSRALLLPHRAPSAKAVLRRLDASPDLSRHVTTIELYLPVLDSNGLVSVNFGLTMSILAKLPSLREASIVQSALKPMQIGNSVKSTLRIVKISKRMFERINLWDVARIPPSVVPDILVSAPYVAFYFTSVSGRVVDMATQPRPLKPLERLLLCHSPSVNDLLLRSEFASYTKDLRELTLYDNKAEEEGEAPLGLVFATARTLQRLSLHFVNRDKDHTHVVLPARLPNLRFLFIAFPQHDADNVNVHAWNPPAFLTKALFGPTLPLLAQLELRFCIRVVESSPGEVARATFPREGLREFDDALASLPRLETVRWTFSFQGTGVASPQRYLTTITSLLRSGLPQSSGRLGRCMVFESRN